ncbi:MAG: hypothetical protein ACOWWR_17495 [Eubacteriales bacterium]
MGFLDNLFCDDNTLLIILIIVGAVFLFSGGLGDNCGIGGGFNLGDNWLLIVILILVLAGDGLNIF